MTKESRECVVVTGSAGFIGGHLTDRLLECGFIVIGVDNLSSGLRSTFNSHVTYKNFIPFVCDITSNKIEEIFRLNKIKYVFHLAAQSGVVPSIENPVFSDLSNVNATLRLLDLSKKYEVERFIFSSSSSVYGGSDGDISSEADETSPRSPYALQKLTAENYCKLYSNEFGLDTVSLRYFNVIGARQRADSAYAAVLPAFSMCRKIGAPPIIYGDGTQSRDFTWVGDVVSANILSANYKEELNGEVFNVARGESRSLLQLCELLNLSSPIFEKERVGDIKHSFANIEKIKGALGYRPIKNIDDKIIEIAYSY